jgi:poly(3-hydroxybutyrate) depolymerase
LPARQGVDDADYIADAVGELQRRYGLKPKQTFALGLSNGAMMAQAMLCHHGVFARIVAIAGPLQDGDTRCPEASGRAVLAIHGDTDTNVPISGGMGSGIARVDFNSEAATQARLTAAGATYRLLIVKGAAHRLRTIADAMTAQGTSLGETAVAFLAGQELP